MMPSAEAYSVIQLPPNGLVVTTKDVVRIEVFIGSAISAGVSVSDFHALRPKRVGRFG